MEEIWKLVYVKYEVSNFGRMRRLYKHKPPRYLKGSRNKGYVFLSVGRRPTAVHRIVAQLFIPNPDNKPQVNHKDGNPSNNHVSNLEWCTQTENNRHARELYGNFSLRGDKHPHAKLTDATVRRLKKMYATGEWSHRELAEEFELDHRTVGRAIKGEQWSHIE